MALEGAPSDPSIPEHEVQRQVDHYFSNESPLRSLRILSENNSLSAEDNNLVSLFTISLLLEELEKPEEEDSESISGDESDMAPSENGSEDEMQGYKRERVV